MNGECTQDNRGASMIKTTLFFAFVGLSFCAYYFLAWLGINRMFNTSVDFPMVPVLAAAAGGVFYVWVEVRFSKKPWEKDSPAGPAGLTGDE